MEIHQTDHGTVAVYYSTHHRMWFVQKLEETAPGCWRGGKVLCCHSTKKGALQLQGPRRARA